MIECRRAQLGGMGPKGGIESWTSSDTKCAHVAQVFGCKFCITLFGKQTPNKIASFNLTSQALHYPSCKRPKSLSWYFHVLPTQLRCYYFFVMFASELFLASIYNFEVYFFRIFVHQYMQGWGKLCSAISP